MTSWCDNRKHCINLLAGEGCGQRGVKTKKSSPLAASTTWEAFSAAHQPYIWANEEFIKTREIISQSHEQSTPCLSINQGFTVDIPTKNDFREPNEAEYEANCYTDGSKINELSGAGIVVIKGNLQVVNINHNVNLSIYASTIQSFRLRWWQWKIQLLSS